MPGQDVVVMVQRRALWETVGEVDWSDAYWGFPPNQYMSGNFFGILQSLLVFTNSRLHTTFGSDQYI